jgi:hypothetical protein
VKGGDGGARPSLFTSLGAFCGAQSIVQLALLNPGRGGGGTPRVMRREDSAVYTFCVHD